MEVYVSAIVRSDGGLVCGRCGSADHWFDTQTDVGCSNCGVLLPHDQHDAHYAHEV